MFGKSDRIRELEKKIEELRVERDKYMHDSFHYKNLKEHWKKDSEEAWKEYDRMRREFSKLKKEMRDIKDQADNDIGSEYLNLNNILDGIDKRMSYHQNKMVEAGKAKAWGAIDRHHIAYEEASDIYFAITQARNDKWRAKQLSNLVAKEIDRVAYDNGFLREITTK